MERNIGSPQIEKQVEMRWGVQWNENMHIQKHHFSNTNKYKKSRLLLLMVAACCSVSVLFFLTFVYLSYFNKVLFIDFIGFWIIFQFEVQIYFLMLCCFLGYFIIFYQQSWWVTIATRQMFTSRSSSLSYQEAKLFPEWDPKSSMSERSKAEREKKENQFFPPSWRGTWDLSLIRWTNLKC